MFTVTGTEQAKDSLGSLTPKETLDYYDGPKAFTCADNDGHQLLAYWIDRDDPKERFVVVPCTNLQVQQLKNGDVTIYSVLNQPDVWVADVDSSEVSAVVKVASINSIPPDCLPQPDVYLATNKKGGHAQGA